MSFLSNLGRTLLGAAYLAIPIVGWIAFARSIKRVNPGEISIVNNIGGSYELLNEGLYFRPFPGDYFGESYSKALDYIDFGPVKRIRVKQDEMAVKNADGKYVELPPGIHLIDHTRNETYNKDKDIQKINQVDYTLGATRYVTLADGELGESYIDGKFAMLGHGKHALPPNHRFIKKVPVNSDIVDLGALKIITVKEGQVAIVNGKKGTEEYGPGKHEIKQEEGCFFQQIINVSPQVTTLVPLTVMFTDKVEMTADAVLLFKIEHPLKIVGSGEARVLRDLKELSEGTLRSILRKFSADDISLSLHPDAKHSTHDREKTLQSIHDNFVKDLDKQAEGWGIKILDLRFTQILPADAEYHNNLRQIGCNQSRAASEKTIAETNAAIANIKAQAEQSKVTAAKIEQEEETVRAQTEAKKVEILAKAQYEKSMAEARAKADGIKAVAEAERERLQKLGGVADSLKSQAACNLAMLDKQREIYAALQSPVYVPQPELGQTRIWSNDGNRTTLFTSKGQGNTGSSDVKEYLALEAGRRMAEIPKLGAPVNA